MRNSGVAAFDSYIICTSPRSGSTLLCKLLEATGVAGVPGSHFHDPSISDWLGYYNIKEEKALGERETLEKIFRAAIAYGTGGSGVFGLRLQRHSVAFFMEKLMAPELARRMEVGILHGTDGGG